MKQIDLPMKYVDYYQDGDYWIARQEVDGCTILARGRTKEEARNEAERLEKTLHP